MDLESEDDGPSTSTTLNPYPLEGRFKDEADRQRYAQLSRSIPRLSLDYYAHAPSLASSADAFVSLCLGPRLVSFHLPFPRPPGSCPSLRFNESRSSPSEKLRRPRSIRRDSSTTCSRIGRERIPSRRLLSVSSIVLLLLELIFRDAMTRSSLTSPKADNVGSCLVS